MAEDLRLPPEIEKYHEKWRKDPTSRVFAQLADAYRKTGMLDEAIEVCVEGLKVHPSYNSARVVLGRAYLEKGMEAEAESEFQEVIKSDPDNILARRILADLLYKEGRIAEAVEQYQRLLKLTPLDREIRAILEKAEADMETPAPPMVPPAATEEVEVAVETIGPEAPPVPEEGPIVVLQEPSTKEEDAFLTETIADLYVKQGLYDRAIEIFSKLLSADPDNPHFQERLQEVTLLQKGGGTAEPSAVAQTEETEEPEKEEPEKEEEERVGQISLVEEDLVSESVPPPIPASVAEEAREPEVSEYETMASPEEETPPQLSRGRPSPETLHRWLEAIKQRRKLMGTEWDSEND